MTRRGARRRAAPPPTVGRITVVAGVNGAGKSSIVGATIREAGGRYYNPDEEARALRASHPQISQADANASAWEAGRRGLERAIARREDFVFETTLGGRTIARLLGQAIDAGLEVAVRYVGLDSPERHIARVRARVAAGGHDIPESTIRERYEESRRNLIALLPLLSSLVVYDNSVERDLGRDEMPEPTVLLRMESGRVLHVGPKERIPSWARPIIAAALLSDPELQRNRARHE